jgi:hypothetical protein
MDLYSDKENQIGCIDNTQCDNSKIRCLCQGECQCGNKYKRIRPVYYEVDVNQIIESLNDWD